MPGLAGLAAACTRASSSVRASSPVGASVAPTRSLTPATSSIAGRGWHTLATSLDGRLIRPGRARLSDRQARVRPAVRRHPAACGGAGCVGARRRHDDPVRPRPRDAVRGSLRRAQLRRLLAERRHRDRRDGDVVGPRGPVGRASDDRVRRNLDAGGERPRARRPRGARRHLCHGRDRGARARRRSRRHGPPLRAHLRLDARRDGGARRRQRRACDANRHPDLFWGLRGGGGGNLGVVTSFTFTAHPLTRLTICSLSWPWSKAAKVVDAWSSWAPSAPRDLWSSLRLRWIPGSGPQVSMIGTWSGAPAGLAPVLHELTDSVRPATSSSTTMPYLDVAKLYAGCSGQSADACTLRIHGGVLPRQASLAKSDFFDHPIASAPLDDVLGRIESRSTRGVTRQLGWRGPRRLGRRDRADRTARDRVPPPPSAVPRAGVRDLLHGARRRHGRHEPSLAHRRVARVAPLGQRRRLRQLHRPGAPRLGGRLLRREPRPARRGQAHATTPTTCSGSRRASRRRCRP